MSSPPKFQSVRPPPVNFVSLVVERQRWIADVLQPWCRQAARQDLLLAEQEWLNLAGKVEPEGTLWAWAWNRFPGLVNSQVWKMDETHPVTVQLQGGEERTGYPDARRSTRGMLLLVGRDLATQHTVEWGPFSLDDIATLVSHPEGS